MDFSWGRWDWYSQTVTCVWVWKDDLNSPDAEEGKAGGTVEAKAQSWERLWPGAVGEERAGGKLSWMRGWSLDWPRQDEVTQ